MLKQLFLFILVFNSVFLGFSNEIYGDLSIKIDEFGKTTILGTTNYEDLIVTDSDEFTSKKGSVWTFELSVPEEFSEFIFELELPSKTQINYLKTTPTFRITSGENDNIKIIGTGENRNLNILIQYVFDDEVESFSVFGYYFSYLILGLVVLLIILFVIYKKIKSNKVTKYIKNQVNDNLEIIEEKLNEDNINRNDNNDKKNEEIDYLKFNLNQRQLRIIEILKQFGEISQKDLETELNIPKASVSRNLQSLSNKNIIIIRKNGISNIVSLSK